MDLLQDGKGIRNVVVSRRSHTYQKAPPYRLSRVLEYEGYSPVILWNPALLRWIFLAYKNGLLSYQYCRNKVWYPRVYFAQVARLPQKAIFEWDDTAWGAQNDKRTLRRCSRHRSDFLNWPEIDLTVPRSQLPIDQSPTFRARLGGIITITIQDRTCHKY